MIIDGEERPCHAMDAMHIPSGLVHGAYAGPEGASCSTSSCRSARTSARGPTGAQ